VATEPATARDELRNSLWRGLPKAKRDALLAAYRAEILAEAADVAANLPTPDDCDEMNSYDDAWTEGTFAVARELRRIATAPARPGGE
jgi:hypothetical protein